MAGVKVDIYLKGGCPLCREAKGIVEKAMDDIPFTTREIDITSSEELLRKYKDDIPTIFINGTKSFKYKVDEGEFKKKVRREMIKMKMSRLSRDKARYR